MSRNGRDSGADEGVRPALQRRSREKRERLIKAGMATFARKGYEQTRVVDLANDAGISVGVFYQRFRNKRGFFDALEVDFIKRGYENWDRFFERANPDWSARELFEALVSGLARQTERNVGFSRALVTLGHHDKKVVHPAVKLDQYGAKKLESYLIDQKYMRRHRLRTGQVYFALSTVTKTLLVMTLNDAGPFRTADRRTTEEFAQLLARYLGIRVD